MKKTVFTIIILLCTLSGAQSQRIKGSDTLLPLSQKAAEEFMKANSSRTVTVTGGGSGVGISALFDNTTDIALSSRRIRFDERQRLQDAGRTVSEVVVAYDALAVVVHPGNPVSNLTREQLEGIFTGRITNWREVGGEDLRIIPYSRETSSGTYEFFRENVLRNRNYVSGIMSMPATGAIIQSISQTRGAIGYVGLGYVNRDVKTIRVSYNQGNTYIEPTVANAKNETYPIVRPLYYYYVASAENTVKPFIDYLLSETGQGIVSNLGYVPVK